MASEKSSQELFEVSIDDNFKSDSPLGQKAAKCTRWVLLIVPMVISLLALVAMIVAIVIFSSTYKAMLEEQNAALQKRVSELEAAANRSFNQQPIQGVQSQKTYVRWGNSTCSDIGGTTLLYTGYAGGTSYFNRGGGSNQLCMPLDPEYTLLTESGVQANSQVYGAEYESAFLGSANENVPCAVCSISTRTEVLMIPAKTSCPDTWTREYYGYLMSENHGNYRTTFICVDRGMEFIPGSTGHADACDLWTVEASCASMPCPPYDSEKELGCAICSK